MIPTFIKVFRLELISAFSTLLSVSDLSCIKGALFVSLYDLCKFNSSANFCVYLKCVIVN